ncbi:hypothetical protein GCM10010398_72640 [Streptomyces fimbriatus]
MSRAGAAWTDMDRPVAAADPVIWRTSRFWTVSCIHVPALDTKFATDHQRMLRCRRDRQGERGAASATGAAGTGAGVGWAGVGWAGVGKEDTVRYSETSRRTLQEGREAERRLRCAAAPVTGTGRGPSWQKGPPSRFRAPGRHGDARTKWAVVRGTWGSECG